jgi:hypothetical protein
MTVGICFASSISEIALLPSAHKEKSLLVGRLLLSVAWQTYAETLSTSNCSLTRSSINTRTSEMAETTYRLCSIRILLPGSGYPGILPLFELRFYTTVQSICQIGPACHQEHWF